MKKLTDVNRTSVHMVALEQDKTDLKIVHNKHLCCYIQLLVYHTFKKWRNGS